MALCLYWFVKVEIKDANILKSTYNGLASSSSAYSLKTDQSNNNINEANSYSNQKSYSNEAIMPSDSNDSKSNENLHQEKQTKNSNTVLGLNTANKTKTNFEIFMDELLDKLRNVKTEFY